MITKENANMQDYTLPVKYYAIDGDAKIHALGSFTGEDGCDDAATLAEEITGGYFTVIDQYEMMQWVNTYLNDLRDAE